MNYYGAKELAESFRTVRKNTLAIAQDIPADKYSFRPAPDTRSVAELLTHIALAYTFQYQVHAVEHRATLQGFDFPSLMGRMMAEEKKPRSKDEILALLRAEGEKWAGWLQGISRPPPLRTGPDAYGRKSCVEESLRNDPFREGT